MDRRLEHAVAVARVASFTKAAEVVGLTQSAITKSIADLESQLGYSLFLRTARGAMLTDEGREFVEHAARLIEDSRVLLTGSAKKDPFAVTLRIGVCPASLEWLLADPLADLLQGHPSVRFELVGGKFETTIMQLRGGAIDLAVGFDAAFADWKDIRRHLIASFEATIFVRKGHPLLDKASIGMSDLAQYPFVSPSDSRPYGEVVRRIYEEHGENTAQHLHVVDCFPVARQIVATSDAIGVASGNFFSSSNFSGKFAQLPGPQVFHAQAMCCAVRSRWEPRPPVRALIEAMRRRFPPPRS